MISLTLLLVLGLAGEQQWNRQEAILRDDLKQGTDQAVVALAQFLQERGRFSEAETLFVRSHDLNVALHGAKSVEAATSLFRLGTVYHAELRLSEAEAATREAVDLFESNMGTGSLDYGLALANLAAVLADEGQNARAEPILRRALFLVGKRVPASDPVLSCIEANLGMVYLRQGEFRNAEPLLRGALSELEASGNLPGQSAAHAALAELAIGEQHWDEAGLQIDQAYRMAEEYVGVNHPWVSGILHLRALVEAHKGDFRKAASDFHRSIELLQTSAGAGSPFLEKLLREYEQVLHRLGHHREARAVRKQAQWIAQHHGSK